MRHHRQRGDEAHSSADARSTQQDATAIRHAGEDREGRITNTCPRCTLIRRRFLTAVCTCRSRSFSHLQSKQFLSKLEKMHEMGKLVRIVIDEVHCQWPRVRAGRTVASGQRHQVGESSPHALFDIF